MVTHVVLFRLKDRSRKNIEKARDVLLSLKDRIPVIRSFEVGADIIRSERSYDLALVSKFDNLDDLEAYRIHPEHVNVVDYIAHVKESSIAVDYES
ncbi:MAG: stress responsive protein [Deltaproteobacteria bacterium RBG_19FT_COMBO_58_16]|nr:MAG: stress responsive protein [Deltaproteobacteria bacterium RBG_19FT_COMBO_58_16]